MNGDPGRPFSQFWLPDEIRFADSIPLTSVGKRSLRARTGTKP
jgi:non-ribosomal peptide synthetase component E (peptide arylation enzyme)